MGAVLALIQVKLPRLEFYLALRLFDIQLCLNFVTTFVS